MDEKYKVYAEDHTGCYYIALCKSKAELDAVMKHQKNKLQRRADKLGIPEPSLYWVKD